MLDRGAALLAAVAGVNEALAAAAAAAEAAEVEVATTQGKSAGPTVDQNANVAAATVITA